MTNDTLVSLGAYRRPIIRLERWSGTAQFRARAIDLRLTEFAS